MGLNMPSAEELMKLPQGRYTLPQAREALEKISRPDSLGQLAMGRKARTPEERLAARLIQSMGGVRDDPEKIKLLDDAYSQITHLPREKWDEALNDFQARWKNHQMEEAGHAQAVEAARAAGLTGQDLTRALSPETIKQQLGAADRQVIYRSALASLSRPVEAIHPGGGEFKTPPLGQTPAREFTTPVRPRYSVGDYKDFLADLQEHHPEIQEWMAQEVWKEAVHDYLINAPGKRIEELLRPARLEQRIMGESRLRRCRTPAPPRSWRILPGSRNR